MYNRIRIVVMKMKKIFKITIILIIIITIFAPISYVYAASESYLEQKLQEEQQNKQDRQQHEKYQFEKKIEEQQKQKEQQEQELNTKWSEKSTAWWKPIDASVGEDELVKKAEVIIALIRNAGIVVSVIALMIIGIKEMTAGVEEKSAIKQALPGYLLGVIMVVSITMLPSIIYRIVKGL